MKFTLKDYQEEALRDILRNLADARQDWHGRRRRSAFALSATTGAGKTVIAAAAIESLFYGNDEYDLLPDLGAVVLWFSADPTLNEQTRFRLMEASDRISHSDLVVVKPTFNAERLSPGKVYFLNTQKLSRTSMLVRGHPSEDALPLGYDTRPDLRSHTMWDTIRNTIEDDRLTLYLIVDEAHQGMGTTKRQQAETDTIARRLISGQTDVPAVPVVWGISATVDRFNTTMATLPTHAVLPQVWVDPVKVQASGLLKDAIVLDIPTETGTFETVLLRRATAKLKESSDEWAAYAREQGQDSFVAPLMVFQVPNTPHPEDIRAWLETIFDTWPELRITHVAHVFGEHRDLMVGPWSIPYLSPELVQDTDNIRVLLAKDAISTGWDCPRAEVMVSLRGAKDRTHVTQLLGRMVRTPLARSIPGNDKLNSVDCLLPHFDRTQVQIVVHDLLHGADDKDDLPGRRVLIDPVELAPNPAIPSAMWDQFLALPSLTIPRRSTKPVKRLTLLAHELTQDGLLEDGGKWAHRQLHASLDAAQNLNHDALARATAAVWTVEGTSLRYSMASGRQQSYADFVARADVTVIEDAYRRAARLISPDLARTYAEHLAQAAADADEYEDALLDAHAVIGAFWLVPEVGEFLDRQADASVKDLLTKSRVAIRGLSDQRQAVYRSIEEMSTDPQQTDLVKPTTWLAPSNVQTSDGKVAPLARFANHLMCDAQGTFPATFNDLETDVIKREHGRDGFVAWYRNPGRGTLDSLTVPYRKGERWTPLHPDFVFFHRKADRSIGASIVDPHGHYFADAVPKLRGLADYAERYGDAFVRIDTVDVIGGQMLVLDLKRDSVRKAIRSAQDADSTSIYLQAGEAF